MMSRFLSAIIRFYQTRISKNKLSRGCCRFSPTCSCYFLEALQTHGFIKGTALGTWRILRCNPFCKGGFDPVPPKKDTHKVIGKYRR